MGVDEGSGAFSQRFDIAGHEDGQHDEHRKYEQSEECLHERHDEHRRGILCTQDGFKQQVVHFQPAHASDGRDEQVEQHSSEHDAQHLVFCRLVLHD